MNIITPEIIFDRFASRLYDRWDDLDYIIHANSGYEKWAQWELYLCFKDELFPVVYDHDGRSLRENGRKDGELVADIRLEYSYDLTNDDAKRADLLIAKEPFIINKVNLDTWQVFDSQFKGKLEDDYEKSECHYVELKTDWWDLYSCKQPMGLFRDIEEKIEGKNNFPKEYKPCSHIAISIVTFFDSTKPNFDLKSPEEDSSRKEILEKIEGLKVNIENRKLTWLYSHIEDYTYLIGACKVLD